MFNVRQLVHASFFTEKLEETIEFYSNHLGATVVHEFKNPAGERYGVFLAIGNSTYLEFFNAPKVEHGKSPFRHLCFEVDKIESAAAHFRLIGFEAQVQRGKTDKVLQFFVKDPNGIELEFHEYDAECAPAFRPK